MNVPREFKLLMNLTDLQTDRSVCWIPFVFNFIVVFFQANVSPAKSSQAKNYEFFLLLFPFSSSRARVDICTYAAPHTRTHLIYKILLDN